MCFLSLAHITRPALIFTIVEITQTRLKFIIFYHYVKLNGQDDILSIATTYQIQTNPIILKQINMPRKTDRQLKVTT
jgi:hypothetical protein